jgi:hypothetical protein
VSHDFCNDKQRRYRKQSRKYDLDYFHFNSKRFFLVCDKMNPNMRIAAIKMTKTNGIKARRINMESIWKTDAPRVRFDVLNGNKNTDVLIIGGGIAGILCAYKLKNAGVDCLLAEATEICGGITKNTTAKITLQHGLIYDKMIRRFGENKARIYVEAQKKAFKEYARLCENIDCDYETRDSYVYSLNDRKKIEKEVVALNHIGVKAETSDAKELPLRVVHQLHLLEYFP